MTHDLENICEHAKRIAKLAGHKIRELREANQFTTSLKNGIELLTTADLAANELITKEIQKHFPGDYILSEEATNESPIDSFAPTWIIDPIDGTVSYANYQYQCAVSIAFAVDGIVRVGVVYNPFLEELFSAIEGKGALLNGKPIRPKAVSTLNECLVATGFPYKKDSMDEILNTFCRVVPKVRDIRRFGSAALDVCWVACGRLQGYYEESLSPWDVAAGKLIAMEAGAKVGDYHTDAKRLIPDYLNCTKMIVASAGVFEELRGVVGPLPLP
jgi:myo-inositol-1(or 4)-monophosphatase